MCTAMKTSLSNFQTFLLSLFYYTDRKYFQNPKYCDNARCLPISELPPYCGGGVCVSQGSHRLCCQGLLGFPKTEGTRVCVQTKSDPL